jgi:hypothetical protein
MWVNVPLKDFQHDLDVGWIEYCNARIYYWRSLSLRVVTPNGVRECMVQIERFKRLRGMR